MNITKKPQAEFPETLTRVMERDEKGHLNPVFLDTANSKFYFFDETWSVPYGPYDTKESVTEAFTEYCEAL